MKILADENIPYVRDAFGALGDVETLSGRAMTADRVRGADVLLVRSITKVNASLLEGSRVRFVATATIGEDHVDKTWLREHGIGFASAPGSNANSVGEYVAAALLVLAERFALDLSRLSLGIVGVGNVGRCVLAKAQALGLRCVLNDPPLARATGDSQYQPIEEILACDIVTFHVPLRLEGPDATRHFADDGFLRRMKPGAILLNTSRGAVADGDAVKRALGTGHLRACVLDVWEREPNIDGDLLGRVDLGTPHIAGYSFDGKVNGTRMIYEGARSFFGIEPVWNPAPLLPEPECPVLDVDGRDREAVKKAVEAVFDIRRDDTALRGSLALDVNERGALFDRLRKEYPRRREFFNTRVRIEPADRRLGDRLETLGFRVGGIGLRD